MLNVIAAIQEKDRGLGFQNKLLFRLKDDLENFKKLTLGNIVIMGRKTFESIGKALPDRQNFVVTKNLHYEAPGATIFHSLAEALEVAKIQGKPFDSAQGKEIFLIGGGEIYREVLPKADRLYLTIVRGNEKADTFFPDYNMFTKTISTEDKIDPKTNLAYRMLVLEK